MTLFIALLALAISIASLFVNKNVARKILATVVGQTTDALNQWAQGFEAHLHKTIEDKIAALAPAKKTTRK